MRRLRSICLLGGLLVLAAGLVFASQKSLKVDVDLVMINVSVSDSENHPLTELKPENFQIFEDKVEMIALSRFGDACLACQTRRG